MKSKYIIITVISISLFGFLASFLITKSFVLNKQNFTKANVSNDKQKPKDETTVIPDTKIEEIIKEQVAETKTESSIDVGTPKKETAPKITKKISCPKPTKEYEDETFLNVGQEVPLYDKTYVPDDLVGLDKDISKSVICIKEEVATALKNLTDEAKVSGHNIVVSSGFRDYDLQNSILTWQIKSGNKNAYKSVAKPGYSEHQLGVAVDLTSSSIAYTSATIRFGDTEESKWLEDHASEYGFVQSYPKGKEDITGYIYEPWHYRYVGKENAMEIVKSGKTVGEYLKDKNEKLAKK